VTPETVIGASGAGYEVLNQEEKSFWNKGLERYVTQFKFENIADLHDLDRVLMGELLCHRWGSWLIREADYDGRSIEEIADKLYKQKLDQEKETRILKEKMGLNRARRQDSESQAVHEYVTSLLRRAKEFGVHRDEQIAKSIALLHEVFTQVGLYYRTDEEEQAHLGVTPLEILNWINTVARDEFNDIDDAFRKNQRLWIKEVS
jgi:hypothetical protein